MEAELNSEMAYCDLSTSTCLCLRHEPIMRGRRWRQRHRKKITNLVPRVLSLLSRSRERTLGTRLKKHHSPLTCCGNPPQVPQVLFGCHRIKVIVPDVQTRRKSARTLCASSLNFFLRLYFFAMFCLKRREIFLSFLAWWLERSEVLVGCYCCRFWSVFKAYGRFLSEGSHHEFCTTTSA